MVCPVNPHWVPLLSVQRASIKCVLTQVSSFRTLSMSLPWKSSRHRPFPLELTPQTRYIPLLQALIHTSAHDACISLPDRHSTEVGSNSRNPNWAINGGGDDGGDGGDGGPVRDGVLTREKSPFRINSSKVSMHCSAFSARRSADKRVDSTRVKKVLTCAHWPVSSSVGTV